MIAGSLAAAGVIWGIFAVWIFRQLTDEAALRRVLNRLHANLLEIRLFAEEPALVWKAQKAVIGDNVRFLALVAKPVVILGLLFALLYSPLDSVYGWHPVAIGHSAVVTMKGSGPKLVVPNGIVVETPPVRVTAENETSWRIRAVAPGDGEMRAGTASIRVLAGDQTLIPKRRRAGPLEIDYPKGLVTVGPFTLPWLSWFLVFSALGALFVQPFTRFFVTHKTQHS